MKKRMTVLIMPAFVIIVLAGCGAQAGLNIVREIPLPNTYAAAVQSTSPEIVLTEATAASVQSEDALKSLDEIKARAVAAGFETSALFDFQKAFAADVVDGFNIEIGSYSMPVMEFPTPESAQAYADTINEGERYVAVVNGRYLTMVSASNGMATDKEQQAALEEILDAKAQEQKG